MAKTRNENSHYSTFTRENNVTLVQSFVNNDLRDMVSDICEREEVKLGAFVEWCIAIGVNEQNKRDNNPARFDEMKLHYATHTRRSSRVTFNAMQAEIAALRAQLAAQTTATAATGQSVNALTFSN